MGDIGRSSILVHILVISLCLTAFGFAIAAERRRSTNLDTTEWEDRGEEEIERMFTALSQAMGNTLPCISNCWSYKTNSDSTRQKLRVEDHFSDFVICFFLPFIFWICLNLRGPWDTPPLGSIVTDSSNTTFCVYDSDVATGYSVGAFLFLLSGHSILMGVTRCMCFGAPLAPGGTRAWSIIYFTSSWITFAIAEACLVAGATKNAYHTKYRDMVYAGNWTCQSLRKGVFITGAVFVVFNMILNVYFYMYYTKATSQAATKISKTTPSVSLTGYADQ